MIAPILAVKDVDASLAFYIEKLGFERLFVMEGPNGKASFAFVSMGLLAQIGLEARPTPTPVGSGVVLMIYPPEEVNLDKLYADVQRRGVAIEKPLRDEYWGDRTFSVKDPDGYQLTFSVTEAPPPVEEFADIMRNIAQL